MVTDPGPAASSIRPVRSTLAPSLNTVTPVIGASVGLSAAPGTAGPGAAGVSVMAGSPR